MVNVANQSFCLYHETQVLLDPMMKFIQNVLRYALNVLHIQGLSTAHSGIIYCTLRDYLLHTQGLSTEHSGIIYCTLRGYLLHIRDYLLNTQELSTAH